MSYILDALRKSEQQRAEAEPGPWYAAQVISGAGESPPFLLYGVIVAVLLGTGMLIGWHFWRPDAASARAPAPPEPVHGAPAEPAPRRAPPGQDVQAPVLAHGPSPRPRAAPPSAAAHAPPRALRKYHRGHAPVPSWRRVPESPTPLVAQPAVPAPTPPGVAVGTVTPPVGPQNVARIDPAAARPAGPPAAQPPAAPAPRIVALEELPPAIQLELPRLSVSGFSYSETPGERLAGVNDHLMREGQSLGKGIRLERINRDGLIFSYKEYLFRVSMP